MIAAIFTGCMVFGVNQTYLLIAVLVVLACARTGFNYSLGNDINYEIEDDHRGKYFAVRDLFLYGGISLGLFLGGQLVKVIGVSGMYAAAGLLYVLPLVMIVIVYRECGARKDGQKQTAATMRRRRQRNGYHGAFFAGLQAIRSSGHI